MKSAIFKIASRADDQEGIQQVLADAQIIFATDDEGNPVDGCGWNEIRRVDEDYIEVGVKTTDDVMDTICQDPRLELVKQLEGWPEEIVEEEDIIDI